MLEEAGFSRKEFEIQLLFSSVRLLNLLLVCVLQCSYLVLFQKINDVYGPVALALLKKTDSAQRETKKEHKQR